MKSCVARLPDDSAKKTRFPHIGGKLRLTNAESFLIVMSTTKSLIWLWIVGLINYSGCDTSNPNVTLETNKGRIVIELYPDAAPKTVDNFATLIQQGFYDGLSFHRYVPEFVIQGGDPAGDGTGDPGWTIYGEFQDSELRSRMPKHKKGVIAMARKQHADSAGSQFYICLNSESKRYEHLEGDYTTFGRVIEGLEVVDQLREGDKMNKVTLKDYQPTTIDNNK